MLLFRCMAALYTTAQANVKQMFSFLRKNFRRFFELCTIRGRGIVFIPLYAWHIFALCAVFCVLLRVWWFQVRRQFRSASFCSCSNLVFRVQTLSSAYLWEVCQLLHSLRFCLQSNLWGRGYRVYYVQNIFACCGLSFCGSVKVLCPLRGSKRS